MRYFIFLMHGFLELFKKKRNGKSLIDYTKKENFELFIEKGIWGYLYLGNKLEKGYFNFFTSENNFPGEGFLRGLKYGLEMKENVTFFLSEFLFCADDKIVETDLNLTQLEKESLIKEISRIKDFKFFIIENDMILKFQNIEFPYEEIPFPNAVKNKYLKEIFYKKKEFEIINQIMMDSIKILTGHPVNKVRADLDEKMGNFLYIYGMGKFAEKKELSKIIKKDVFYYSEGRKINSLKEYFSIPSLNSLSEFQDNSLYIFEFYLPFNEPASIWVKKFEIFEREFLNPEIFLENSKCLFVFDPFFEENKEYQDLYSLFLAVNFPPKSLKKKYKNPNLLFQQILAGEKT